MEKKIYRKVSVAMYNDVSFRQLSPVKPSGQSLLIWLLTGPATTSVPGLLTVGKAAAAEMLDWPVKDFSACFAELEERDIAVADWDARVIWLPNAIKHNPPTSANQVTSWVRALELFPQCELTGEAISHIYKHLVHTGCFDNSMRDGIQKAYGMDLKKHTLWKRNSIPNSETETETETETEGGCKGDGFALQSPPPPASPIDEEAKARRRQERAEINDVLSHYRKRFNFTTANYPRTDANWAKIKTRLKKFKPELLKAAIDACADSAWHQEKGATSLVKNILDSDDRVVEWLKRARNKGAR